uniref:Uncharacterized protein n=1 Tax=Oryza nivara TaxID=4536 RepID=A0A0E0ITS6_ORYNI
MAAEIQTAVRLPVVPAPRLFHGGHALKRPRRTHHHRQSSEVTLNPISLSAGAQTAAAATPCGRRETQELATTAGCEERRVAWEPAAAGRGRRRVARELAAAAGCEGRRATREPTAAGRGRRHAAQVEDGAGARQQVFGCC